ncbi:uncharacterized protein LOC124128193 [Haliotis rufescens]|uniref:uncharacterized protein LOC124128193 n=1 Tax=Haliotis rufescens TaxID=6454 RepID=UPI00201FAF26|nr:uncharacterized protein LOC124128193 [Haliotis rufescens]
MEMDVGFLLAFVVLLCLGASTQGDADSFTVTVNTNGSYSIAVQGNIWLKSAPTFVRVNEQIYSTADGSLKLLQTTGTSGTDFIGKWQSTNFLYQADTCRFLASIYVYTPDPSIFSYNNPPEQFLLFKQTYLTQTNATMAPTVDETIAGFPGFVVEEASVPLGYLSYGGDMYGDTGKAFGQFGPKMKITSGIRSGPLSIFDRVKTANTLILSPASTFMSANLWQQTTSTGSNLYWGIMGGVSDMVPEFETSTILFYSNQGINKGFVSWGQILQKMYGRDNSLVKSDFTNNYLGYWTDNGAYYYYKTEPEKNYQDTILDIASLINDTGIPFRYLQFDSWWYYKGAGNGVKTWESTPEVFPNGMQWLYNKTGLPISAHNRYWSSDTTYAKQNGGKYLFLVENDKALPIDQTFWDDLLSNGRKWGLMTYEQDWLNVEFAGVPSLTEDVYLAETWLNQMGRGAAKNGLTIQYCMANSRHILQGITLPAVTQARASDDYHPGTQQWRIGVSSVFAWAIGIAPFKDNFWTTTVQPGTSYKGATEPYTELNALVATLSTGPVGPSDMIGKFNKTIIMKSVNSEGLILKPSRPATAIDNMIRRLAWNDFEGPDGEVWSTYSDFGGSNKYGIVLAADLHGNYTMTPCMAGFQGFPKSMVFPAKDPNKVQLLTDPQPLQMSGCTMVDFCLYYVSPVVTFQGHQVLIQGELDKWVPMSPQRVVDINVDSNDINVRITGGALEEVKFWFNTDGVSKSVTCYLGNTGDASISYKKGGCQYD